MIETCPKTSGGRTENHRHLWDGGGRLSAIVQPLVLWFHFASGFGGAGAAGAVGAGAEDAGGTAVGAGSW